MGPPLDGAEGIPHLHWPAHIYTHLKLLSSLVAVGKDPVVLSWVGFMKVIGP